MKSTRAKLLAYVLALAAVFAAAWTLGAVVGPDTPSPAPVAPAGNPHGH
jgi:hypothetical protein